MMVASSWVEPASMLANPSRIAILAACTTAAGSWSNLMSTINWAKVWVALMAVLTCKRLGVGFVPALNKAVVWQKPRPETSASAAQHAGQCRLTCDAHRRACSLSRMQSAHTHRHAHGRSHTMGRGLCPVYSASARGRHPPHGSGHAPGVRGALDLRPLQV